MAATAPRITFTPRETGWRRVPGAIGPRTRKFFALAGLAAMGAVAGLASEGGVEVVGMEASAVSYPGFEQHLRALL